MVSDFGNVEKEIRIGFNPKFQTALAAIVERKQSRTSESFKKAAKYFLQDR